MFVDLEGNNSDKYIKYYHKTHTDGSKKEEIREEKEIISLPLTENDL